MKWVTKRDSTGWPYQESVDKKHWISKAIVYGKARYTLWANGQLTKSFDSAEEAREWLCHLLKG